MKAYRKSRIDELVKFDKKYAKTHVIIGTDEAGRGPVAGPVVACALCFHKYNKELSEALKYLDDSKKFSSNPKLRKELSEEIKNYALYGLAECTVKEIEEINILQASLLAMKRACNNLISNMNSDKDIKILIDGRFLIKKYPYEQIPIVKGDSKSAAIAAASIIAKVHRDEMMIKLAEEYPKYNWHQNKGYPTPAHLDAIRNYGICCWHRRSFLSKLGF